MTAQISIKAEMVWSCVGEGWWRYWTKDAECGAVCSEGGHAEG